MENKERVIKMQVQTETETKTKQETEPRSTRRFYFDTSIWLDFFEDRDEPNFPKSMWTKQLVSKIINNNYKIIISDANYRELNNLGYSRYDLKDLLFPVRDILIPRIAETKQIGKAKDLAIKRMIPKQDALHAILARDNRAILISLDNHFKKIIDITIACNPKEF